MPLTISLFLPFLLGISKYKHHLDKTSSSPFVIFEGFQPAPLDSAYYNGNGPFYLWIKTSMCASFILIQISTRWSQWSWKWIFYKRKSKQHRLLDRGSRRSGWPSIHTLVLWHQRDSVASCSLLAVALGTRQLDYIRCLCVNRRYYVLGFLVNLFNG